MYPRELKLSESRSFFLFGARGTGKSELLRHRFRSDTSVFFDLLEPRLQRELAAYPERLRARLAALPPSVVWVIIDEIQKAPQLLDVVHQELAHKRFRFALTGSSARKLKRGAANLLAGRAFVFALYPLSAHELGDDFNLEHALSYGTLPELFQMESELDRRRFLRAYADTYLREEIIVEQIVRNLPPFRRFLDLVGVHSGEIINGANWARDIDSDPKTVRRYFEILEDTLLGFHLPSFGRSIRKKQRKAKKFYLFDTGVARALADRLDDRLVPKTFEYGQHFENFVINEVKRRLDYSEQASRMSFLRVSEDQEVDLVVEKGTRATYVCEIKSTDRVDARHARAVASLGKEIGKQSPGKTHLLLLSRDPMVQRFGDVVAQPWWQGIEQIIHES